ncbi:GIY-YIG nuclease family protein [Actinospongicola halichondriae]|uniref:GIY-YIG nuclease family protein n=1 Tax=Actinospongicola halichondriae TaxID=3236844 RepID=UPI003D42E8F9
MITLNDLLLAGGVDPKGVLLLRHKVGTMPVLDIWRTDRPRVEGYQSRQLAGAFDRATHVACFLVSHTGTEVFGGLYRVEGSTPAPIGSRDVLTGEVTEEGPDKPSIATYDLTVVPEFECYEDRLVIQWFTGGKHPGWKQWAARNPKPIVEIATQREQPFPGWLDFCCPVDEIGGLPRTWREVLRSTAGVYLLTDSVGRHYVGSAKGGDGFLGRWDSYRDSRSGGNIGLQDAVGPYTVTVLQTFDPSTPDQTVEGIESLWKDKLGARLVGYNRN